MGNDGNYDDESISRRVNADLANDLGEPNTEVLLNGTKGIVMELFHQSLLSLTMMTLILTQMWPALLAE